jgi:hypothetical protein
MLTSEHQMRIFLEEQYAAIWSFLHFNAKKIMQITQIFRAKSD